MLYKLLNKKTTTTFVIYFILCQLNAQIKPTKQDITNRPVVINITNTQLEDYNASILKIAEIRKPAGDYQEKKNYLNIQRALKEQSNVTKSTKEINGIQENKFISNILQFNANSPNGTPNDNSVAISDSGYIVSVVNTNLVIYNDTGKQLLFRNLGSFASSLTLSGSISDPRVIFDPIHKKFIIAFFSGNNSSNSTIVLAFSQSANPLSPWNFYTIKGNPNNDTTWSDYPIISITKDDFFITFNQLKDNEGWKTGFRYAAIWQVDKQKGFNGDSIKYNYWDKIKYNNKSVWSICPVMKSGIPTDNKSYFLSVRPSDLTNDTVFIHTISNSYKSGLATLTTAVYKTNIPYGLAPDAMQKDSQYLATNDARVLHAVELNGKIFYVQNCIQQSSGRAGIYLGTIDKLSSTPQITGNIIAYDSLELGYPSISAIGNYPSDEKCVIYVNFVKKNGFAGCMALYKNKQNNISEPLILKYGEGNINRSIDTLERWGDYSGIQQYYWEPNSVLIAGYYARNNSQHGTWISKISLNDSLFSSIEKPRFNTITNIYPNPSEDLFNLKFEVKINEKVIVELYNTQGIKTKTMIEDYYTPGLYQFQFSTHALPEGLYILKLQLENSKQIITQEIIKEVSR